MRGGMPRVDRHAPVRSPDIGEIRPVSFFFLRHIPYMLRQLFQFHICSFITVCRPERRTACPRIPYPARCRQQNSPAGPALCGARTGRTESRDRKPENLFIAVLSRKNVLYFG
jgi:hypothetical protein